MSTVTMPASQVVVRSKGGGSCKEFKRHGTLCHLILEGRTLWGLPRAVALLPPEAGLPPPLLKNSFIVF
jgi:hypothetical protein